MPAVHHHTAAGARSIVRGERTGVLNVAAAGAHIYMPAFVGKGVGVNSPSIVDGQRIDVATRCLQFRGDSIDVTGNGIIHTLGSSRSTRSGHHREPFGTRLRQRHGGAGRQTRFIARRYGAGILNGMRNQENVAE